jgi:2-methylcitrate dehydratase PrpD
MINASSELEGLAGFALGIKYEDLPPGVIRDVKYFLLDSIGCGLAGVSTAPGKMWISLAEKFGGPPESSIIGVKGKVSCVNAAMANGQLINALDFDCISGHAPPFIIPPPLALAESVKASGKEFILALAIGLEIGARLSNALPRGFMTTPEGKFKWGTRFGYACHNFAAAAAAGRIIGLNLEQMLNAMGAAGHLSQVHTWIRYTFQEHRSMTKYGVPGWQNTGAVTAALLAREGFTGDTTIFDPEQGFWKFTGYEGWNPENILKGLGKDWSFFTKIVYKPYPCCRMFQTELDCFLQIINANSITAEEIESVRIMGHPTLEEPAFTNREINSIADVQFGPANVFAMAAHRIPVGVEWQDMEKVKSPEIQSLAGKISYGSYPDFMARQMSIVEVKARGKVFREEKKFVDLHEMTADDLLKKFRHNASRILSEKKAEQAAEAMLALEKLKNTNEMTALITG